jgi:hypothetical protein
METLAIQLRYRLQMQIQFNKFSSRKCDHGFENNTQQAQHLEECIVVHPGILQCVPSRFQRLSNQLESYDKGNSSNGCTCRSNVDTLLWIPRHSWTSCFNSRWRLWLGPASTQAASVALPRRINSVRFFRLQAAEWSERRLNYQLEGQSTIPTCHESFSSVACPGFYGPGSDPSACRHRDKGHGFTKTTMERMLLNVMRLAAVF